ncbi:26774_t:CDS:2, partial [Gigaspora margarita]
YFESHLLMFHCLSKQLIIRRETITDAEKFTAKPFDQTNIPRFALSYELYLSMFHSSLIKEFPIGENLPWQEYTLNHT